MKHIKFKSASNFWFFAASLSVALIGFFGIAFNPICVVFAIGGALLSIASYKQQI